MQEQSGHDKKSFMGYIKVQIYVLLLLPFEAARSSSLGSHNALTCCSLG